MAECRSGCALMEEDMRSLVASREMILIPRHVRANCQNVALVFLCYQLVTWQDDGVRLREHHGQGLCVFGGRSRSGNLVVKPIPPCHFPGGSAVHHPQEIALPEHSLHLVRAQTTGDGHLEGQDCLSDRCHKELGRNAGECCGGRGAWGTGAI